MRVHDDTLGEIPYWRECMDRMHINREIDVRNRVVINGVCALPQGAVFFVETSRAVHPHTLNLTVLFCLPLVDPHTVWQMRAMPETQVMPVMTAVGRTLTSLPLKRKLRPPE
eukprot:m.983852 g.983852  ORF g.983852 m.983852 type:complete len:112 (-) comp23975_c0_seq9:4280-4615(-)